MISNADFVAAVKRNAGRVSMYNLGGDGTGGACDCIGLIIGAIRLCGGKWPYTHGSNWAARNAMRTLLRVSGGDELAPGDIVYKAREPGESGYALPDKYRGGADEKDYYHVGVVTGVEPLEITHCTSVPGGIKRDSTLGAWRYAGRLKMVELLAEGENNMGYNYRVIGGNLNQRAEPGKDGRWLQSIPNGTRVHAAQAEDSEWMLVDYNGKSGYCMAKWLEPLNQEPEAAEDADTVAVSRDTLARLRGALESVCAQINQLLTED